MKQPRGVAIDLGSARTRVWTPTGRLVVDTRTRRGLVSRGKVLDREGVSTLVGAAVASREPELARGPRPIGARPVGARTAVVTTPVLCDDAHRDDLRAVLHALGVTTVVLIDAVKAAAFGARADVTEPLLVVDLGAQLTEIALLGGGCVVEARRIPLGLDDARTVVPIVEVVADTILELLRGPYGPQLVDALDRGVLLVGGGALRPEITYKLSYRLGASARPAPAPHTAAVRGAATALQATHRHPSTPTPH
ncbi:rod shape-determining protein [Kribbella sp. NPDC048928]|uniref:rod shape-determining protein n=1 Tax=Kribbella sp. NPDC048928 TaxID=3364111 RepID=UPI003712D1EA